MRNDVTKSASYSLAKPMTDYFTDTSKQNIAKVTGAVLNPDAKSLALDPRFQKILQDPEIQQEIQSHDIAQLMRNPKMIELTQQIMSDPAAMKKVLALYSSQTQAQALTNQ